jgi:hypothetical protein
VNSSSIIFAFFIAGFLSVTVHDVFFGPIAYGPNNAMHQVAKSYRKDSIISLSKERAIAFKGPAVSQEHHPRKP